MTTASETIAGPERPGGQGLDRNQHESGNHAILALLTDPERGPQTDLVLTCREGDDGVPAYEVWAHRGMIRFIRFLEHGGGYGYRVIEQIGQNPIANQDQTALATIAEELAAAGESGFSGTDPQAAFIEPEHLTYPLAYERIAQLFDSPNAPDIAINPKHYAFGRQPGQHGSLDVVQSRAPLIFSGPGVKGTGVTDALCAQVDIAPTLARLLGMPLIDGKDSTGRTSSERGVPPDVYFKRQDGNPIEEIIDETARPERVYIFLFDGLSNSELKARLEKDREAIPNIARIIENGLMFNYGTIVNFPSITWPSHNALGTGAWCGHHDIVNPTYYLRDTRQVVTPQGSIWETGRYLSEDVETFYEACHRVFGKWDPATRTGVVTASINEPCMRGAAHSTLERRLLVDGERLRETARNHRGDTNPRWKLEEMEHPYRYSGTDIQGLAQALMLFSSDDQPPPIFTYHEFSLTDAAGHDYGPHSEGVRDALIETDKRVGKILSLLDDRGLYDSTLFVITTDHGMAPIDVSLAADQVQAVPDAGICSVVTMPLVYLLDMDVTVEPSHDGRTVNVTVLENDPDRHGEKPPIEGASVEVIGPHARVISSGRTDSFGVAGLPLRADVDPADIVVKVEHEKFNRRHLRLDGSNVLDDPRERLYGHLT